MDREYALVLRFKEAKDRLMLSKEQIKTAQKEYDGVESELLELLQAQNKDSSAKYSDLGHVTICKPILYASCPKENEDKLFSYLRKENRGDLVREAVNSRSLSSYIKELIDAGNDVPDFISYYLRQGIRFYAK